MEPEDIVYLREGGSGVLTLTAFPQSQLPFTIQRVAVVSEQEDAAISYRTEASLDADVANLRPGMEGVGKIHIGERNYLWIWFHGVADWVRLKMWAWLP